MRCCLPRAISMQLASRIKSKLIDCHRQQSQQHARPEIGAHGILRLLVPSSREHSHNKSPTFWLVSRMKLCCIFMCQSLAQGLLVRVAASNVERLCRKWRYLAISYFRPFPFVSNFLTGSGGTLRTSFGVEIEIA